MKKILLTAEITIEHSAKDITPCRLIAFRIRAGKVPGATAIAFKASLGRQEGAILLV